jgi:16S rRNA pseudouridine516 synthase
MERLDKILSVALSLTRSQTKKLIKSGAVSINGEITKDVSAKVNPSDVLVNSTPIEYKEHIYIMLNKPQGVVSASEDSKQKTVIDLLPDEMKRAGLFPAGRLDKDTTGFVLITDDGDFAHSILSPKKHITKTYEVTLDKPVDTELIDIFKNGVELYDGTKCLSADLTINADEPNTCTVKLHEGRYHQIKRMFSANGLTVTALHRSAMGNLPLDETLNSGECRELQDEDIMLLLKK